MVVTTWGVSAGAHKEGEMLTEQTGGPSLGFGSLTRHQNGRPWLKLRTARVKTKAGLVLAAMVEGAVAQGAERPSN